MPWKLPETATERLALARGYPFPAPRQSYLFKAARVLPIDGADFKRRTPVLAHGSNRAPEQLARKFLVTEGPESEIPVTLIRLQDHDVVYSAHITRYGSIASNLVEMSGCAVWLSLTWLTERQLQRMHETEGSNYPFGTLDGVDFEVADGPIPSEIFTYRSRHGSLLRGGYKVPLRAVSAEGRSLQARSQTEMLDFVATRFGQCAGTREAVEDFILRVMEDEALRLELIRRMEVQAI